MSDTNIFDLSNCTLCPRNCHADRIAGRVGYCGEPAVIYAARAALLKWEEPVITGPSGSGAVFFSGCNMGCIFCQNYSIAHDGEALIRVSKEDRITTPIDLNFAANPTESARHPAGLSVSSEHLTEIMLRLQDDDKATNINLVTPTHYLPAIIPALRRAKAEGLHIPVVYNTSSYEKVDALKALEGLVDIYLPDLKYVSSALSSRYSAAPDYFAVASAAIAEMVRQQPEPCFADGSHSLDEESDEDDPVMLRGVIVRHLALPGAAADSKAVLDYLYKSYGDHIFISLMNQYTPMPQVRDVPALNRRLTDAEYEELIDYCLALGVENGFIQDGDTAEESFIPAFNGFGLS